MHPKDGEKVEVRRGRFGPFLMHGKRVANLPRGTEMEAVTLDEAVTLLAEKGKELPPLKGAKGKVAKAKPTRAKPAAEGAEAKAPTKKPAAKKAPAKKPAARKAPATTKAAKA
jgi:DNA topoisomerase-1